MKVIIVSITSQYIHSSLAPWYLLSYSKEHCPKDISVAVLEATVNEDINSIYLRIKNEEADIIAFSTYIWNIEYVKKLSSMLKKKGVKILLGGPEVSYCAEKVLKENKAVNYVLSGEGEAPFSNLLNAINSGKALKDIEGLSYRKNGKLVLREPYITNEIPVTPYTKEYFKALKNRIAYIETSRGCPFSCAFCLSGRYGTVRYFPIELVKQNILQLANSGSKIIKFVDRTFNANKERAYEIFRFIIENYANKIPRDVCFHFEIAGDLLREKDFSLLAKAPFGAIQFEIGIQSFNNHTLEAINRKTNINLLKENIKKLVSLNNIHTHIDLIAGLPKEDIKSFRESFNMCFSLKAQMLQLGFLKMLYGAQMRENIEKYPCEFSEKPPYEVTSTPWLNEDDIKLLKCCENALERFCNSLRFSETNKYIFEIQKRSPFETLIELGMFTGSDTCSLNEYVNKIYSYFEKGSDTMALRDALVCDIASSVKSRVLPSCLIIADKRLKKFKNYLESNQATKRKKGVLRTEFLLYSKNCGAYVDYDIKENGKYKLNFVPFDFNE